MKKLQYHKRGALGFFNGRLRPSPRPRSPLPSSSSSRSTHILGNMPRYENKSKSFQNIICKQLKKISKNYCRYRKRADILKTSKQKLLAICRLRNSRIWISARRELSQFLSERQMQNLAESKSGRRYMEKYYLAAIWSIDKWQIKKMVEDFNKTLKHKSTKPLKVNDFFPYLT